MRSPEAVADRPDRPLRAGPVLAVGMTGGLVGALTGAWWIRRFGKGRVVLWSTTWPRSASGSRCAPGGCWAG